MPKDPQPAPDLFSWDDRSGRQSGGWSNKLIWGDNKLVLASLKNGPLRKEIEDAGGLKLVYIDPPFDVGADFSFDVDVGEREVLQKAPSIIEEVAYRDTWGKGSDSYLMMMYDRLRIIADLLQERATMYVHVGKSVAHMVRCLCDEILASDFCVNEITWKRSHAHGDTGQGAKHFGRVTESILVYRKSDNCIWTAQYADYTESILVEITDIMMRIREDAIA